MQCILALRLTRNLHYNQLQASPFNPGRRNIFTGLAPALDSLTSTLKQKQPGFTVSSADIHVLNHPTEFYSLLLVCFVETRDIGPPFMSV